MRLRGASLGWGRGESEEARFVMSAKGDLGGEGLM